MVTLHKFKLLATKCTVLGSPTQSPTTSPVIHLRRRKTLRMFLTATVRRRDDNSPTSDVIGSKDLPVSRHKLKDLLVISSPPFEDTGKSEEPVPGNVIGGGLGWRRRNLSAALFRNRLLRKPWRPVLVGIEE